MLCQVDEQLRTRCVFVALHFGENTATFRWIFERMIIAVRGRPKVRVACCLSSCLLVELPRWQACPALLSLHHYFFITNRRCSRTQHWRWRQRGKSFLRMIIIAVICTHARVPCECYTEREGSCLRGRRRRTGASFLHFHLCLTNFPFPANCAGYVFGI